MPTDPPVSSAPAPQRSVTQQEILNQLPEHLRQAAQVYYQPDPAHPPVLTPLREIFQSVNFAHNILVQTGSRDGRPSLTVRPKPATAPSAPVAPKKPSASVTEKEMELGSAISEHDLSLKAKKVTQFLQKGYRVKVTITQRWKPGQKVPSKTDVLQQLLTQCPKELYRVMKPPKEMGKQIVVILQGKSSQ